MWPCESTEQIISEHGNLFILMKNTRKKHATIFALFSSLILLQLCVSLRIRLHESKRSPVNLCSPVRQQVKLWAAVSEFWPKCVSVRLSIRLEITVICRINNYNRWFQPSTLSGHVPTNSNWEKNIPWCSWSRCSWLFHVFVFSITTCSHHRSSVINTYTSVCNKQNFSGKWTVFI